MFTVHPWNDTRKSWIVQIPDGRTVGTVKSSEAAAQDYADGLEREWEYRRDELLSPKKATKSMWTRGTADNFLEAMTPYLEMAGYSAEIVGSVKKRGRSDHDLDIRMTPVKASFSDEPLFEIFRELGWKFDYLRYSKTENVLNVVLPDDRVVDFFGGQHSKAP